MNKKISLISLSSLLLLACAAFFYFSTDKRSCLFIPVSFNLFNLPMVTVEIEGNSYPLVLDLGANTQMSLDNKILQKLEKQPYGIERFDDLKGNFYESERYLVPKIRIGTTSFIEVMIETENEDFSNNTILRREEGKPLPRKIGTIGRALVKRYNLLLDFPHSRIGFIKRFDKSSGCPIEKMHTVPFEMTASGIILKIHTDSGEKKFLLDTGTSWNLFKSPDRSDLEYFFTSHFKMNEKDFGPTPLYSFAISPHITDFDGILGMTFLRRHTLYIDFQKKQIQICTSA